MRRTDTFHVYLTGGTYLGPVRAIRTALRVLRARASDGPLGVPLGTIWSERDGVRHLVRTIYGTSPTREERDEEQEVRQEIEKEIDQG